MFNGTLLNMLAVVIGGSIGTLFGARLSARYHDIVLQALGLAVLVLGVQMAAHTRNPLYLIGGLLLGSLVGEAMGIDGALQWVGNAAQGWLARHAPQAAGVGRLGQVSEAFVTSTLVFCVGPMAVLGAIENGVTGKITVLSLKSSLDLFSSFAFAASLGPGVLGSVPVIGIYEGGMSAGAHLFAHVVTAPMIDEMTAVGGAMVVGVGLKLLKIVEVRLGNMLPGLIFAPLLVEATGLAGHLLH